LFCLGLPVLLLLLVPPLPLERLLLLVHLLPLEHLLPLVPLLPLLYFYLGVPELLLTLGLQFQCYP